DAQQWEAKIRCFVVNAHSSFFVERPVSLQPLLGMQRQTGKHQTSPRLSTIRRRPWMELRVVATGSEAAWVSIVSVNGAWCAGKVAANGAANGISPSPKATKRRLALA